jgi:hypothetical protein
MLSSFKQADMKCFFVGMLLLLITITGCERKENIALPYEGDKIVLNSFMQPDSLMYLRVTKNARVGVSDSFNFETLQQAQIRLLEDGIPMAPFTWQVINGKGYFVSASPVKSKHHYTVEAAVPGFKSVTATDSLPVQPVAYGGHAQQPSKRVRFTLNDPAGMKNYYRIRVYAAEEPAAGAPVVPKIIMPYRFDPSFSNNFLDKIIESYYNSMVIDDERFNGRELIFVLETQLPVNTPYLLVEVSALTDGAYQYLKTLSLQTEDNNNIISEPVRIYSNVENGLGIVAGINTRWITIKVTP